MEAEDAAKKRRAYYLKNKKRIQERNKAWYLLNKEKVKAAAIEWTKNNREKKNASKRERYKLRHDHFSSKGRQYAKTRRSNGLAREYMDKIIAEDPGIMLRYNNRYRSKSSRELGDFYISQILKSKYKIACPTAEQIEYRRGIIAQKRAQRFMGLINAANKLTNETKVTHKPTAR